MTSQRSKESGSAAAPALRLLKPSLLATAIACVCGNAWAVQGGTIVGGQGAIAAQGATTNVSQSSDKMVINWQNFDIGRSETVNFNQPSASAAVLNRVVSATKPTEILGSLNANGRVFVINQAGVMFGKTATVNTDSLVASTMDVDTKQFMDGGRVNGGDLLLDMQAGGGNAVVSNDGKLNARTQIALLGGQVVNTGEIRANGNVTLGAADSATLNFKDSMFGVTLNAPAINALARNDGLIVAQGGDVRLSAMGTGDVLRTVVANTGTLEAHTAKLGTGGAIVLESEAGGQISVDGSLTADTRVSFATAPRVEGATTGTISIERTAKLNAPEILLNVSTSPSTGSDVHVPVTPSTSTSTPANSADSHVVVTPSTGTSTSADSADSHVVVTPSTSTSTPANSADSHVVVTPSTSTSTPANSADSHVVVTPSTSTSTPANSADSHVVVTPSTSTSTPANSADSHVVVTPSTGTSTPANSADSHVVVTPSTGTSTPANSADSHVVVTPSTGTSTPANSADSHVVVTPSTGTSTPANSADSHVVVTPSTSTSTPADSADSHVVVTPSQTQSSIGYAKVVVTAQTVNTSSTQR
jgi:filamentous hemagglutinin family protein